MGVKNNLKYLCNSFALNMKKEYQYKTSFWMKIIMMVANDAFFILQWLIVFSLVDNIGGYGFNETMLLWAMSAGAYGFSHTFFGGLWDIRDMVYEGRLDVFLTQPKNVLVNIAGSSSSVSGIGDMLYSFLILAIVSAPWWWYLLMPVLIVLSGLMYAGIYVTYVSLCFYIKRGDSVSSFVENTMLKAGNYPPAIFSGIVKGLLFSFIPALFIFFVPSQYFLLDFNIWWVLGFLGMVVFWLCAGFLSFKIGLKRYNSGSLMGGRL